MSDPTASSKWVPALIISLYLLGKIAIGFYHRIRSSRTISEYEIAGRSVPGFLLGIRLGATNIAGGTVIGIAAFAYLKGISLIWYFAAVSLGTVVYALLLSARFRQSTALTPAQWFGQHYGASNWTIATILALLNCLVFIILQMTSAALAFKYIIGTSTIASIAVIASVFILYTVVGGFRSVLWTDIMSYFVTVLGFVLVVIYMYPSTNHGLAQLPRSTAWNPIYIGVVPILAYFVVGVSWGANVVTLQTSAAALTPKDARNLGVWAAFWMLLPAAFIPLAGMEARAAFPKLASANLAMPALAASTPGWIRGIALAGLIGAAMSAGAGQLLSLSNVFAVDIVRRIRPKISESRLVVVSKIFVVIAGVITMLISFEWGNLPPTVYQISLAGSSLAIAYYVPLLWGLYIPIRSRNSVFIGLLSGIITSVGYTALSMTTNLSVFSGAVLPTVVAVFAVMLLTENIGSKKAAKAPHS